MNGEISGGQRPGALLRNGAAPLVIGHRGDSSAAPENTLHAFQAAWQSEVHWIETDVQPTADLVPVLFHDETLERTSTGAGAIRARRLAELAALDAGSWFRPPPALEPAPEPCPDYSSARIPTMHELLSALPPQGRVLLEIKGPHTTAELITELAVIRATGTTRQVFLQTFEIGVLLELRAAIPYGWRGLLRDDMDPDPVGLCQELRVSSYNPDYRALLNAPLAVDELHRAGISVIVFTSNEEADWEVLTELGVDGIITDRPRALLRWQQLRTGARVDATG